MFLPGDVALIPILETPHGTVYFGKLAQARPHSSNVAPLDIAVVVVRALHAILGIPVTELRLAMTRGADPAQLHLRLFELLDKNFVLGGVLEVDEMKFLEKTLNAYVEAASRAAQQSESLAQEAPSLPLSSPPQRQHAVALTLGRPRKHHAKTRADSEAEDENDGNAAMDESEEVASCSSGAHGTRKRKERQPLSSVDANADVDETRRRKSARHAKAASAVGKDAEVASTSAASGGRTSSDDLSAGETAALELFRARKAAERAEDEAARLRKQRDEADEEVLRLALAAARHEKS
jgi:hypothetical protein